MASDPSRPESMLRKIWQLPEVGPSISTQARAWVIDSTMEEAGPQLPLTGRAVKNSWKLHNPPLSPWVAKKKKKKKKGTLPEHTGSYIAQPTALFTVPLEQRAQLMTFPTCKANLVVFTWLEFSVHTSTWFRSPNNPCNPWVPTCYPTRARKLIYSLIYWWVWYPVLTAY